MKRQAYQLPELRDANDNIIQQGTYGKASPLVNGDNTGVLDYINNNLEALHDAQTAAGNAITTGTLTVSGKTTTGTLEASSATVSGGIHFNGANNRSFGFDLTNNNVNMDIGWNWNNRDGAGIGLRSTDVTGNTPGSFYIYARDGSNSTGLQGYPDGRLTWGEQPLLPVGIVQAFAGTTIPNGWLLCDGSAVSRTTYASLYAVIGTTYGTGDGSTTFNLPNLVDKFIQGNATSGTKKTAGLPNITGSIGGGTGAGGLAGDGSGTGFLRDTMINGCFQPNTHGYGNESGQGGVTVPSGYPVLTANFDASRSSDVYGNSTTVQPPALTMRYIIKY